MKHIRSVTIQYGLTCQITALVTLFGYLKRDPDPVLLCYLISRLLRDRQENQNKESKMLYHLSPGWLRSPVNTHAYFPELQCIKTHKVTQLHCHQY